VLFSTSKLLDEREREREREQALLSNSKIPILLVKRGTEPLYTLLHSMNILLE
jgi:hypothetical protein